MGVRASRPDPQLRDVLLLAVGVAGLAVCLTLVYLGMRSVMDVGGACADGGPYVSAQPCPSGAPAALTLGILGLFVFGGVAMVYGSRVGGVWAAAPLLAWSALFLSLGWNFLEYGIISPPPGEGIVWGWAIPGVLFILMGAGPLVLGLSVFGSAPVSLRTGDTGGSARPPGRIATMPLGPAPDGRDPVEVFRSSMAAAGPRSGAGSPPTDRARQEELAAIADGMEAAVAQALGQTAAPDGPGSEAGFKEGTQALLDRLERLADLRDRGLLAGAEYETAKEAVMRELEARA